jgi:predicted signal transduction protein with EAL and GGDEF domain
MEALAALIITILLFYNSWARLSGRETERWFMFNLILSLAAILTECGSVWCIRYYSSLPTWFVMLEESVNFIMICACAGMIAMYVIYLTDEHAENRVGFRAALIANAVMFFAIVALVVYNLRSGWIFYFDDGQYRRGALNRIGYVYVALDIIMAICTCIRNRKTASRGVKMMLLVLPVTIVYVTAYQLFLPETLMNGMIMALSALVIFISFRSNHVGVDSLTGLHDRGAFLDELDAWMRDKKKFRVFVIKLCDFKHVNLNCGNKAGDELLYRIARFLNSFEVNHNVFRISGDSFAMICDCSGNTDTDEFLGGIVSRFEKPWYIAKTEYSIGACFCEILWQGQKRSSVELMERLEYGLQLAKNKGAGERVVITAEMDRLMQRRRFVIDQTENAVREDRIEVHYQPVYSLRDDGFRHAEALVRLRADSGEMISPGEFIPIAEETGTICEISWVIAEKVCKFLAENKTLSLEAVSINLSVQQFLQPDMENRLLALLDKYGIEPKQIKIEITERILSDNPQRSGEIIRRLAGKGIGFYLDDFGVGYSNIASVLSLPLETIKLDKSLTDMLLESDKDHRFISAIVEMFRQANYTVIAEGAEDGETVLELGRLGVDKIQGYYYSKPLPEEQFCSFMSGKKAS